MYVIRTDGSVQNFYSWWACPKCHAPASWFGLFDGTPWPVKCPDCGAQERKETGSVVDLRAPVASFDPQLKENRDGSIDVFGERGNVVAHFGEGEWRSYDASSATSED